MRIVCQQTILMKYHALFVIFEKSGKICNCRLLQIIGGALRVNLEIQTFDAFICIMNHSRLKPDEKNH